MPVPDVLVSAAMLHSNERPIRAWRAGFIPLDAGGAILSAFAGDRRTEQASSGYLIATNRRIVFLEMKGLVSKNYNVRVSIEFPQIKGSGLYGGMLKTLMISVDCQGRIERFRFGGFRSIDPATLKPLKLIKVEDVMPILNKIVKNGLIEIESEKRKERVQYVLDFSFLKAKMEQGGVVLQTIKCPSCGAGVALPAMGTAFKCQYCGNMILAEDVFEKMKGLIGGLESATPSPPSN